MSITETKPQAPSELSVEDASSMERLEVSNRNKAVAWTSLLFAVLQSVCTAISGLQGLRLVIGISSLALSSTAIGVLDRLHVDWIRVPMVVLALAGSVLNIIVLVHTRRLRNRAAGSWRRRTRSARDRRMEAWQWTISIVTLISIAVEEYFHLGFTHHL